MVHWTGLDDNEQARNSYLEGEEYCHHRRFRDECEACTPIIRGGQGKTDQQIIDSTRAAVGAMLSMLAIAAIAAIVSGFAYIAEHGWGS